MVSMSYWMMMKLYKDCDFSKLKVDQLSLYVIRKINYKLIGY
jgi:hypothetical protein